jgi:hypothetical protein
VDIKRISRGDWLVVAGFVVLLIGTSLSWYVAVERYTEGTMRYGVSGWAYAAGWLSWLAGLAAVVVIVLSSGVIRQLHIAMHGRAPLIIMGLGGVALLLVLIGLITKSSYADLGAYLQAHLSSGLIAKAQISSNWSNEVDSSAFGVGIFFSLVGAAIVAGGGFLKIGEPVPAAAPSTASDVVSNAVQTAKVAFVAARAAVKTQGGSTPSLPTAGTATPPIVSTSSSAAAPAGAQPAFCAKCGAQFPSGDARFCPACGANRTVD